MAAKRAGDMIIENNLSLFGQGLPDISGFFRRRADFPFFAVVPIGDGPGLTQGYRIGFILAGSVRIFVYFIKYKIGLLASRDAERAQAI